MLRYFVPFNRSAPLVPLTFGVLRSFAHPGTCPVVAELDGTKPGKELVIGVGGSPAECVRCYDAAGNQLWTYAAPYYPDTMGVAVGDVDGDGNNEVALGLNNPYAGVTLLDHAGGGLWHYGTPGYCRSVSIGKMRDDYDGLQILCSGYNGNPNGFLRLLDKNGDEIWTAVPVATYAGTVQGCKIADMGDGAAAYCVQDRLARRYSSSGAHVWTTQITSQPAGFSNRSYGLDVGLLGGAMRIAAVNETSGLTLLDKDGNIVDQITVPYRAQCVAIGDANNDGQNEVVVEYSADPWTPGSPGGVVVINAAGEVIAQQTFDGAGPYITIGDVNNDGKNEIVAPIDDGNVYILGWA